MSKQDMLEVLPAFVIIGTFMLLWATFENVYAFINNINYAI